eukprot:maker-scaffold1621_size33243-snap-gene-0.8 protein:Tk12269 transcript:maker-scaffold1621_size33243-snap-gene-0.8-mRNA-1 annotation:"mannose-1-phosphate guanylyltransferase"
MALGMGGEEEEAFFFSPPSFPADHLARLAALDSLCHRPAAPQWGIFSSLSAQAVSSQRGCVSYRSGGCYRPNGIANLTQNQSPRQLLQVGSTGQVV